jgi:hypothetical protein
MARLPSVLIIHPQCCHRIASDKGLTWLAACFAMPLHLPAQLDPAVEEAVEDLLVAPDQQMQARVVRQARLMRKAAAAGNRDMVVELLEEMVA